MKGHLLKESSPGDIRDERPPKKILILTQHQTLGRSLKDLIGLEAGLTVTGEAETMEEARRLLDRCPPDLVLVDRLALSGVAAKPEAMFPGHPRVPILLMTMDNELAQVKRGLGDGIRGFVTKHDLATELISALRTVLEGRRYLSRELLEGIPEEQQELMLTGGSAERKERDP